MALILTRAVVPGYHHQGHRVSGINELPLRKFVLRCPKQLQKRSVYVSSRVSSSVEHYIDTARQATANSEGSIELTGIHHIGLLCENLERSLHFYCGLLGLKVNHERPEERLPFRGAWLWVGAEMIHLMELPNPDPVTGRPVHGGRDRHSCVAIRNISPLAEALEKAGIPYTLSKSGRRAVFTRDPDGNALEFAEAG